MIDEIYIAQEVERELGLQEEERDKVVRLVLRLVEEETSARRG